MQKSFEGKILDATLITELKGEKTVSAFRLSVAATKLVLPLPKYVYMSRRGLENYL